MLSDNVYLHFDSILFTSNIVDDIYKILLLFFNFHNICWDVFN